MTAATSMTGGCGCAATASRAHSDHLTSEASVVFASEPMDDADWQLLAPGELVHVDADLQIDRRIALPDPPKHQLRHEDLTAQAAASQHASVA